LRENYLHHEEERVQHDQQHDEIFKRRGHYHSPDFVFETVSSVWHVSLQGSRTDREIDAGFLQHGQTKTNSQSVYITKANRERLQIACLCNFTSALTHRLHTFVLLPDLIFVDFAVLQFRLALLLEGDDNQGNEDVDEEEREHYEVNHVEYGHFDAKVLNWTLVFVRRCH
jgi:hypothetical protein